MAKNYILGISCFYHDSAATLICDGEILYAAQEERFSRIKHDSSFPRKAINFCLKAENINLSEIQYFVYYEKPFLTFERLLETYISVAPRGIRSFITAMEVWTKEKLFLKKILTKELENIDQNSFQNDSAKLKNKILFSEHHLSHAASAFYPSPFKKAAILCMDGVGEWATTSAWVGIDNEITPIWEINFPHSLGLLYSSFTYYCGFKVNSGEYKLMGLAPYGQPRYVKEIKDNLIDIKEDGTFRLNMLYFKFQRGLRMTSKKFNKLFGKPPRVPEDEIKQFHMDLAASIQVITEEILIKIAKNLRKETGIDTLCLAGGVALNCVANGKLLREKVFKKIWIQPASGDAGSSLGAALIGWHKFLNKPRIIEPNDSMKGTYLGCKFSNEEIKSYLKSINAPFKEFDDDALFKLLASYLDNGQVIGWFNGPMEFGPRALGGRSIIGDPRNKNMQSLINLKIKFRESFRPFAPSILEENVTNQFDINSKSPYMLFVAPLKKELCKKMNNKEKKLFGIEKLKITRSDIPAVTHVDYSARIQTVSKKTNPRYHKLIHAFKEMTGNPSIVNTSFNVRGEPIVCTPEDAYRCFMRTEMDVLVLENQLLLKSEQPILEKNFSWKKEFKLD